MSKLESSIKTTSTNEKSPNYQMRLFIVGEIYSTELSYLKHLKKLRKLFMEPFEEASKTPNPLVNPKLIPTIFAYIDDLIKLSNELVKSMRFSPFPSSNNLQYIYNNHRLGQTFLRYYKDFDIYQKYAKNHRKSRNAIKKANKNVLYRKFVQQSLNKKETNRLTISDYMIMPIQRVTRYCLLLQKLKEYTPKSHIDYNDICKSLDNMISLASICNNNIKATK
nr:8384_t:CDS:2 [Entrophospora candida]